MFAASAQQEIFRCPGETYAITRSVHLARLAAFYSKCRHCPYASCGDGDGELPGADGEVVRAASGLESPKHESHGHQLPGPASLFTSEGVRGRYLNEITRALAAEIAGAAASCQWDADSATNLAGPAETLTRAKSRIESPAENDVSAGEGIRLFKPERSGPSVVVAHDERPSSPDIVTGVGQALRRMGCQVVDVGLATRPCLLFAIDHLQAAGGIHVTGAGGDPGIIGLDFVGPGGIPCSAGGTLDRIAARWRAGYARASHRPGSQRTFHASVPYEAGLWKHFHALRPLKIALACPSQAVRNVLGRVFHKVACRLIPVDTPVRLRVPGDPTDPDLVRIASVIGEVHADLGVLIEDDGEQCTFLDERGRLIEPARLATILRGVAATDVTSVPRTVFPSIWQNDDDAKPGRAGSAACFVADASREQITQAMRRSQAIFGADGNGRYWFTEAYPACDAVLTIVHLLQALSYSDEPASRVIGRKAG